MEEYTITYTGQLKTTSIHHRSGSQIKTEAPVDNKGTGSEFSPTDLVANGLGTCILTIMGMTAAKHDIPFKGAKAEVQKEMGSRPRHIAKIKVSIHFPDYEYTAKQKKQLEESAYHCPVANSLHPDIEEVIEFNYNN